MSTSRVNLVLQLLLLIAFLRTPGVSAAGIPCRDTAPAGVVPWTLVYDLADGQRKLYSLKDEALRAKLNKQLGTVAPCADGGDSTCLANLDQQLRDREETLKAIRSQGTVQKRIISSKDDVFAIYAFYRPIDGQPEIARPSEEFRRSRLQTDLQTLGQIVLALVTGPEATAAQLDQDDRFHVERGLALCAASYKLTEKRAELTLKARLAQNPALTKKFLGNAIEIKQQRLSQGPSDRIVAERLRLEIRSAAIDLDEAMDAHEGLAANQALLELNGLLSDVLPEALTEIENRLVSVKAALEELESGISQATGDRLEELEDDRDRFLAEKPLLERHRRLAKQDLKESGLQTRIDHLQTEVGRLALVAAGTDAAENIRAGLTERLQELSASELNDPEARREVLELFQLADDLNKGIGGDTASAATQEAEFAEEILRTGPTERLHLSTDPSQRCRPAANR